MGVVEASSEIGLEHDWLDAGRPLFGPAQSPGRVHSSIRCASESRLSELPGVEQQARVHFGQNLAGDRSQQLHFLLEMGFLVLSTNGVAVCTVSKILKMADEAGDIAGYRGFWHGLPPTKNQSVLSMSTV